MVSGSDQHGTPITIRAEQEGKAPREIASRYHQQFLESWKALGIFFDLFTSTGTANHANVAQDIFLTLLDKGHTRADFITALEYMRAIDIALAPTFVAFTPWTQLEHYLALLTDIHELQLVEAVAPVQLSIRLLIPAASRVLDIEDSERYFGPFDPSILGHPWQHPDPRMDRLQQAMQTWVQQGEAEGRSRREIFAGVWRLAHEAAGRPVPPLQYHATGTAIPRLSENWYCCAEPTCEQLASF